MGISKTAYSDETLKEDAEQVLIQYCLDTDYELLDYAKKLEDSYLDSFYDYLNKLNGGTEGYVVSPQDQAILENQKKSLNKYQNINEIDNIGGTKTNASEINAILNTEMLCIYIEAIKSGNYGNDLDAYKKALEIKIMDAQNKKRDYDQRYDTESKLISGDPDAETEEARLGYNGRSAQYRDLSDPAFIKLQQDITASEIKRVDFKALSDKLDEFTKCLDECLHYIEEDFETSAENKIYEKSILLREEINRDKIQTDNVIKISEEIYNELIGNNTSADDNRITEYVAFQNNVRDYKIIINQKKHLEEEIASLNNYSSELLLGTVKNSVDILDESGYEQPDISDGANSTQAEENDSTAPLDKDVYNNETWKSTWNDHLFKIQSVVKELPETASEDTLFMPKKKVKYLEEISDRRRLYLTDINDFERAWNLLFSDFHPVKYKLMLFVSIIIAFGLDLISFSMGCLLFRIKK